METSIRTLVRQRAGDQCEYCRLSQEFSPFARFQIEHIIPRQHRGATSAENLALSCQHCNAHKGPNLTGIDPLTQTIVPLFHPRHQSWEEHFAFAGPLLDGLSPTGRATVQVMAMNDPDRVQIREEILALGFSLE